MDEEQVKRSSTGGSLKSENFLSAHLKEIKAPRLGPGQAITISSVNLRTLFTPRSLGILSVGKMF